MRIANLVMALCVGVSALFLTAYAAEAKDAHGTKKFVEAASIGGDFEVMSSNLALERSQNVEVKKFAQQMIDDHAKISKELKENLPTSAADLAIVPGTLDEKHQEMYEKLRKASSKDFNKHYIKQQVSAHKETVELFKKYAEDGKDPQLKNFAARTLPVLKQHLEHAKYLKKSL